MSRGTHWTPEQYREYQRKRTGGPELIRGQAEQRNQGPVLPNKTELEYRDRCLLKLKAHGASIRFQSQRFYLANGHSYRPDWIVVLENGQTQCHEVKGEHIHSRDSKVLFDQARVENPRYFWVWAQKRKEGWVIETE